MTTDDLRELLKRLHDFEREVEFGNLPEYIGGGWSRRNFRSLLQDIHSARHTVGQHRIGEYIADYTMPSREEIGAPDPELDELRANSRAVGQDGNKEE